MHLSIFKYQFILHNFYLNFFPMTIIFELLKKTFSNFSVLNIAIKMNMENDVYYLIQLLEEVDDDGFLVNFANNVGETALHRAVELGKENIVKLLMKIKANPNCPDAKGDTVFHTALKSQHNAAKIYEIVNMLCNYDSLEFDLENDGNYCTLNVLKITIYCKLFLGRNFVLQCNIN